MELGTVVMRSVRVGTGAHRSVGGQLLGVVEALLRLERS